MPRIRRSISLEVAIQNLILIRSVLYYFIHMTIHILFIYKIMEKVPNFVYVSYVQWCAKIVFAPGHYAQKSAPYS